MAQFPKRRVAVESGGMPARAIFSGGDLGFPGMGSFPVGFLAAPNLSAGAGIVIGGTRGNPAPWSPTSYNDTWSSNTIYAFWDFLPGSDLGQDLDGVFIGASRTNITFWGCRFQGCPYSHNPNGIYNVRNSGGKITFYYSTFCPRVSLHPTPPVVIWPSAGAGTLAFGGPNDATGNFFPYMIPYLDSCQYVTILDTAAGPSIHDHCDMWGYGNALPVTGGSLATVVDSYLHDAAASCDNVTYPLWNSLTVYGNGATVSLAGGNIYQSTSPGNQGNNPASGPPWSAIGIMPNYHTDGPGYINGNTAAGFNPGRLLYQHNTIASLGSQNGIALQGSTPRYDSAQTYSTPASSNPPFVASDTDSNVYVAIINGITGAGNNPLAAPAKWSLLGSNAYSNVSLINNYLSGFFKTADFGAGAFLEPGNNNFTVTDNIFGTDINSDRLLEVDFSSQFSTNNNKWRRNTFRVAPGSVRNPAATFSWTSGDNGKFVRPDNTLNTADWPN